MTLALIVRHVRELRRPHVRGAALAALRRDVLAGAHAERGDPCEAQRMLERIDAIDKERLKVLTERQRTEVSKELSELVGVLLEALALRLGGANNAAAWESIDIREGTGRGLLSRQAHRVDWSRWSMLRNAALGR